MGIIVSAGGRGCYVDREVYHALRKKAEDDLPQFQNLVEKLLLSGISEETLTEIIKKVRDGRKDG